MYLTYVSGTITPAGVLPLEKCYHHSSTNFHLHQPFKDDQKERTPLNAITNLDPGAKAIKVSVMNSPNESLTVNLDAGIALDGVNTALDDAISHLYAETEAVEAKVAKTCGTINYLRTFQKDATGENEKTIHEKLKPIFLAADHAQTNLFNKVSPAIADVWRGIERLVYSNLDLMETRNKFLIWKALEAIEYADKAVESANTDLEVVMRPPCSYCGKLPWHGSGQLGKHVCFEMITELKDAGVHIPGQRAALERPKHLMHQVRLYCQEVEVGLWPGVNLCAQLLVWPWATPVMIALWAWRMVYELYRLIAHCEPLHWHGKFWAEVPGTNPRVRPRDWEREGDESDALTQSMTFDELGDSW
ncbi:hypothetical protein CC78DRAFT_581938 [Lojkania enalia]|uniref:Uncharacterized protein n=1 Tax=Lojkania enalia TaxID=147567 RepID=A0A9P4K863_9PLEO|nr:hypothetical protein CC78DRAFT_581938 [Didymosphaeria enalia]